MDPLVREVDEALAAADFETALELLAELEKSNAYDGEWPKRAAEIHRRLQQQPQEVQALNRAADRYALSGDVMKAVVMCKRLVDLAPDDPEVHARLSRLHPKLRAAGHPRPRVTSAPIRAEIEDDLPIGERPLAEAFGADQNEAVSLIPIFSEEDVDDAFDDAMASTDITGPSEVVGTFPLTPFFAALREDSFKRLVEKLTLVVLQEGDVLFRQGDPGSAFYVISEGAVELSLERPEEKRLATLHEGEFFGEIALITDHPRTATARTTQQTVLIEVDRGAISELIYEDPEVMTVLLWFLRDRLVDTLVRTHEIFSRFPHGQRRALADRFRFLEVRKPSALIEQGADARGLIVLLAGSARVLRQQDGAAVEIATLGPGEICGEMSLLTGQPAVATVQVDGHLFALEISVEDFKSLVAEHPDVLLTVEDIAEARRVALERLPLL